MAFSWVSPLGFDMVIVIGWEPVVPKGGVRMMFWYRVCIGWRLMFAGEYQFWGIPCIVIEAFSVCGALFCTPIWIVVVVPSVVVIWPIGWMVKMLLFEMLVMLKSISCV